MSTLACKNVAYAYEKGKGILTNISFSFESGKMYAILGPSGSGKTTLLSLLGGLDTPAKGNILFDDTDITQTGLEEHRRNHISLIFQNYNLIDYMTPISSLMISVTFASIMTLLAILNTNKAGNVVVSMILALVLLVSGSFIHQKLGEPKLYDNYVTVNEMGIPTQVEQLPNPQYIEGTPRIVLEVLSDLLPSGQAIQLADAFDTEGMTDESIANAPYRWMGYSLLVTFLTSVLGIALFRKKEIR